MGWGSARDWMRGVCNQFIYPAAYRPDWIWRQLDEEFATQPPPKEKILHPTAIPTIHMSASEPPSPPSLSPLQTGHDDIPFCFRIYAFIRPVAITDEFYRALKPVRKTVWTVRRSLLRRVLIGASSNRPKWWDRGGKLLGIAQNQILLGHELDTICTLSALCLTSSPRRP